MPWGKSTPDIAVVGVQQGDESKGRAADQLGDRVDLCVCCSGDNNTGHTLMVGGEIFVIHLLPSRILDPGTTTVIGSDVVVGLDMSAEELQTLVSREVEVPHPLISANIHIITEYHKMLDKAIECFLGKRRISIIGRGVGPAYSDKVNRVEVRIQSIFDESILRQKVEVALDQKNQLLVKVYNCRPTKADTIIETLLAYAENIRPHVADSGRFINDALNRGEMVLFEGAQAYHLDVDHGTYPYITSSDPIAASAYTRAGVSPTRIDQTIGITKAYTTRVGEGPFPTEPHDKDGDGLRHDGGKFGAITGRSRRCDWSDVLVVEQAVKVNGFTDTFLTKLDILSGQERIPVCVTYDADRTCYDVIPIAQSDFHHATPVYEGLPDWSEDTSACRDLEELPADRRAYVKRLEELIGCHTSGIGVGPGCEQTITINDLL